jgi:hypothetical protein
MKVLDASERATYLYWKGVDIFGLNCRGEVLMIKLAADIQRGHDQCAHKGPTTRMQAKP